MTVLTPPIEHVEIQPLPPLSERERIHAAAQTVISLAALAGEEVEVSEEEANVARHIFKDGRPPSKSELKMPGTVLMLDALLTEYDYELVADASRIRNYVVAKLVEESTGQQANARLKALELLGKITEVGLFTDRKEVLVTHQNAEDLQREIRESLMVLLGDDEVEVLPQSTAEKTAELAARAREFDISDAILDD